MSTEDTMSPEDTSVRVVDRRWWARAAAGDQSADESSRQSDKPAYVQELEQRLAAKDAELRETVARYREASSEFEAMRARLRRDVARDAERSRQHLLADLLEVVDNLDRALDAARRDTDGTAATPLAQGVELVKTQFLSKLGAHGVLPFASLGRPFDPTRHEAAATVPVSDAAQEGTVVGIIREGYAIGAEVLRPALVAVGRLDPEGVAS